MAPHTYSSMGTFAAIWQREFVIRESDDDGR